VGEFWSNAQGSAALSALGRVQTRARFLREVVAMPAHVATCADFRQQVRLLERLFSSADMQPVMQSAASLAGVSPAIASLTADSCFAISS
jgi:hypothetical protein